MNAFISYSHKDAAQLERLHVHLAQLKRDRIIESWTDEEIPPGGKLEEHISDRLNKAELFIALLSPDYIASNYCFEREFKRAQELEQAGKLIIVPIILEPCEWRNTPFTTFKALPSDGKPVSDWSNANTAFLDIIKGLRVLLNPQMTTSNVLNSTSAKIAQSALKNYRVKKDFDSIQKIEFANTSFTEISDRLNAYLKELPSVVDNVKYHILKNDSTIFEAILVNRNKINTETTLKITLPADNSHNIRQTAYSSAFGNADIIYSISNDRTSNAQKGYKLSFDDFHLFWTETDYFKQEKQEFSSKDIADGIWTSWLESVGIM